VIRILVSECKLSLVGGSGGDCPFTSRVRLNGWYDTCYMDGCSQDDFKLLSDESAEAKVEHPPHHRVQFLSRARSLIYCRAECVDGRDAKSQGSGRAAPWLMYKAVVGCHATLP
jgi:hypothetical protein